MNEGLFVVLRREMKKRKYDPATVNCCLHSLKPFVDYFHPCHPRQLTETDIRGYLLHLQRSKPLPTEEGRTLLNALRFLYGEIYGIPFRITSLPHPRRDGKQPLILDKNEFATLISSIENTKHRTLLTLIYSAGLRLGEAVRLKPEDIDSNKHRIHVRSTSGKKDRSAALTSGALEELQFYFKEFRPTKWLFEGQHGGTHLSPSSAEKIFKRAVEKAGIDKPLKRQSPGRLR